MNPTTLTGPARLFTWFGTVVFFDAASASLRHGLFAEVPANLFLVGAGAAARLALQDGALPAELAGGLELSAEEANAFGLTAGGRRLYAEPDGRIVLGGARKPKWERFHVRAAPMEIPGTIVGFEIDGQPIRFFITDRGDWIQAAICRGDFYERDVLDLVRAHSRPGAAFVDVGANIGNHAVFVSRFCPIGKVIAIEPNPAAIELLRINLALNACANVELRHVALAARTGQFKVLPPTPGNLGHTRLSPDPIGGPIRAARGDDLLAGEDVGVVKIDVEGMELEVLAGLQATITRCRPAIFIEVWEGGEADLLAWAARSGYRRAAGIPPDNHLLLPEGAEHA